MMSKASGLSLTSSLVMFILIFAMSISNASELNVPHTFQANTKAQAAQVNENFDAVKTAVNDNQTQLTGLIEQKGVIKGMLDQQLTGTITIGSGGSKVTGNETIFTQEIRVGDAIRIEGGDTNAPSQNFVVASVISDTELEINAEHQAGVLNGHAFSDKNLIEIQTGIGVSKLQVTKSGDLEARIIHIKGGHLASNSSNGALVLNSGPETINPEADTLLDGIWFRSMNNYADIDDYVTHMRMTGDGQFGIGTAWPKSRLQVKGYVQLDTSNGVVPPSEDCLDQNHHGRMKVDAINSLLYICTSSGWVSK
ncbi:MAG: hypothetical protein OEZ58_17730 [Gammaproteobacteria bacterium]|nr:hypothetical protein [Gammaproteobacteria bacterium]